MQPTLGSSWWKKLASLLEQKNHQERTGSKTEILVLLADLKVCTNTKNLERGKQIHAEAMESGYDSLSSVATALVNMYGTCGRMGEARRVFDSMKHPNLFSWNSLILGYAKAGEGVNALDLFERMKLQGYVPNTFTFVAALKACTSLAYGCLERGRQIHSTIGCHLDIYVQNTLMEMYARCGSMKDARWVFDSIKKPDVVSWNVLILGYAENGEILMALELFANMRSQGCTPDSITFVAAIKACTCLAVQQGASGRADCLQRGKQLHADISCHLDVYVHNTLIDMYAKCGSMTHARMVFDGMKHPNVVSWTALILGYAENGEVANALDSFVKMRSQGCIPNSITFVAVLKACIVPTLERQDEIIRAECLCRGRKVHAMISFNSDVLVQNTLIDMYAKCGSMVDARRVFDYMKHPDVVSWTALVLGYAENGEGATALDLFATMRLHGCLPNSATIVAALKACTSLGGCERVECLEHGKRMHSEISCHYLDMYVQNTLIDMYAKCGSMLDARQVFENIKHPNVVSWTTLILGYAENGESVTALDMFAKMRSQSCTPNSITFIAALKACSFLGALETGSKIHAEMDKIGTERNLTCLVDFYAKCGNVVEAQNTFDSHPRTRDLRTWTALLAGYTRLGDEETVFELLNKMQDAGFEPDGVTFLCILTCCCHLGLVTKANYLFMKMCKKITPTVEHYNCMVDLLGRSDRLDDAMAISRSMLCNTNAVTWMIVLSACRKSRNVVTGRLAFKSSVSFNDDYANAYVLMAHIYGSIGMWDEQTLVLSLAKSKQPRHLLD